MPVMLQICKYIWAAPTTCVGLILIMFASGSAVRVRVVRGVIEAQGGAIGWLLEHGVPLPGGASAMTLGHVVIGRDQRCLDETREHERVHVRQCERWGPLFIPAYLSASVIVRLRGRDAYRDNPFEREAFTLCELTRCD
jgi:hypothetical protein